MKISHSASPRNRSSRSSRSVAATGNETAGAAAVARARSVPAMEGPAIWSARDVIWYRFKGGVSSPRKTASAGQLQAYIGLALGRNYVETAESAARTDDDWSRPRISL